jgi:hypothetical protein
MHLIHQQEIWLPTPQGWFLLLGFVTALMFLFITQIYAFLAINLPIKADILVIEGWMQDSDIEKAIAEFQRGDYQKLMVIGPSFAQGSYLSKYKNFAELGAATLIALGFDSAKLLVVPTPDVLVNRTDASAVAVRDWLMNSNLNVKSLNIYTFDVHSRRSRQLFQQALAPEVNVGVIVLEPPNYIPRKWWESSAGVKAIISETISYVYACLIK